MGTHPIFESDFDCLTECLAVRICRLCHRFPKRKKLRLFFHLSRTAEILLSHSDESWKGYFEKQREKSARFPNFFLVSTMDWSNECLAVRICRLCHRFPKRKKRRVRFQLAQVQIARK